MAISNEKKAQLSKAIDSMLSSNSSFTQIFKELVTDYWGKHQRGYEEIDYCIAYMAETNCSMLVPFKKYIRIYCSVLVDVDKFGNKQRNSVVNNPNYDKDKHKQLFMDRVEMLLEMPLYDLRQHDRVLKEYKKTKGFIDSKEELTDLEKKEERKKYKAALQRHLQKGVESFSMEDMLAMVRAAYA